MKHKINLDMIGMVVCWYGNMVVWCSCCHCQHELCNDDTYLNLLIFFQGLFDIDEMAKVVEECDKSL